MTLNAYAWGMKVSTVIAFFAWSTVVLYINPQEAEWFGQALFFITLFIWLSGATMLFLMWVRRRWRGEESVAMALGMSLRQSVFLSVYALILLGMQYVRLLAWWNALLVAVLVLLIELHFLHHSQGGEQHFSKIRKGKY